MGGIKPFSGSIGMTLLILACALPGYENWWPFIITTFYFFSPLPIMLANRFQEDTGSSNACKELALFLTAGIVVSAFALPIVLARAPIAAPIIKWGSCALTLLGNVVMFLTILFFFRAFDSEDEGYSMW